MINYQNTCMALLILCVYNNIVSIYVYLQSCVSIPLLLSYFIIWVLINLQLYSINKAIQVFLYDTIYNVMKPYKCF